MKTNHRNFRHGLCDHAIYTAWESLKTRCTNPKCKKYKNYGGRGIKVCKRWERFENFMQDMLPTWKPYLQIERRNNNGNYCPSNCRWATRMEQGRNKRNNVFLEFNSERLHVQEWSRRTGISHVTIARRIRRGLKPIMVLAIKK